MPHLISAPRDTVDDCVVEWHGTAWHGIRAARRDDLRGAARLKQSLQLRLRLSVEDLRGSTRGTRTVFTLYGVGCGGEAIYSSPWP